MTEDEVREVSSRPVSLVTRSEVVRLINSDAPQGLRLDAIKTHKWAIMTCSAMTGMNLQEGLQWVVQDAKARLFLF